MSQTNEQLFPNTGKVSVDEIFKKKAATWIGKWKPNGEVIKALRELDKSIVNPKGIVRDVQARANDPI